MSRPKSFDELYDLLRARKVPFFMVFFMVVFFTYAILYALDFYPELVMPEQKEAEKATVVEEVEELEVIEEIIEPEPVVLNPLPEVIIFDSLDKTVPVLNPESRDITTLDNALLSGAVRHPDSADYSEDGNVFILAHSSYLPNVLNKHFQAFNGIQNMTWGDKVRVQTADTEYVYRVEKVYQATTDVVVPHTPGEARLTLATCNSFGSKDDRYILEAVLIDTVALSATPDTATKNT